MRRYDAPTKITLPFGIVGLLAFEFFAMHWVEVRRWQDFRCERWTHGASCHDQLL